MRGISYSFRIDTPPVPKARPRLSKSNKWYTPTKTVKYEDMVRAAAERAGVELSPDRSYAIDVTVTEHYADVTITDIGTYQKSRLDGDVDNYSKSILDGIVKIGGWDDRQVMDLHARKVVE